MIATRRLFNALATSLVVSLVAFGNGVAAVATRPDLAVSKLGAAPDVAAMLDWSLTAGSGLSP